MNLFEIGERTCKVGRTSITVCDERGKTCGVVRGVKVLGKEAQPREWFDLYSWVGERCSDTVIRNARSCWLKYGGEYVFALDADTREWCENWLAEHGDMYDYGEAKKIENFNAAVQALEAAGVKYVWLHTQQRYGYQG